MCSCCLSMLAGGSPLSGAGAAAEAEKRLLSMSRQMLAHAAQQSWPTPDDSSSKGSLTAEAFTWDQVRSIDLTHLYQVRTPYGGWEMRSDQH